MEITDTKCGLLLKHLLHRTQQHGGCTKPLADDIFVYKQCLPVILWNKKHSLKEVVSLIYTLGKDFFAAATFKGL